MGKFDGLELKVEKPRRMPVLHPVTRQPIVNRDDAADYAYVEVFSSDSEAKLQHDREFQKRRLSSRNPRPLTQQELESNRLDLFVALTAGWRLFTLDGVFFDLPYTPQNARELYALPSMTWLREQVDEWTFDRANFLTASSTT